VTIDDADRSDDLAGPIPLPPEEGLDDDEVGDDPDEGYSPGERPRALDTWGTTEREELEGESLDVRLAREQPDVEDDPQGDGIGDASDTDGEPIDDEVGDARAGRLVRDDAAFDDELAIDVGVDGGAASAEEAAVHVVPDEDSAGSAQVGHSSGGRIRRSTPLAHVTDALDDLAAFLMRHAYADGVSEDERVETFAAVDAYQQGEDPTRVESMMRRLAFRFRDDPDYRAEWRPAN
jgi:hypothetical protein